MSYNNSSLVSDAPTNVTPPYLNPEFLIADKVLATILAICFVVGTPANTLALVYFARKCRKDIASLLYTAVCFTDACTCVLQMPYVLVLFSRRQKMLFEDDHFCDLWVHAFYLLTCMSIFLVMLISVSRAISIKFPFSESKKTTIAVSIFIYLMLMITRDIVWHQYNTRFFTKSAGFCAGVEAKTVETWSLGLSNTFMFLQVAAPSIIIFLSFIVTLSEFWRKRDTPDVSTQYQQTRRASVTIALFTALFLLCNTPYLLVLIGTVLCQMFWNYPQPFFVSSVVYWYAWVVTAVVLVVINAALNPWFYYFRMNGFSEWVSECLVKKQPPTVKSSSIEFKSAGSRRRSSAVEFNNVLRYHRQVQTEETV